MDPHEVWQENKRWILGVVAGLLVYWVASSIIGGVYSTSSVKSQIRRAQKSVGSEPLYNQDALSDAREEQRELSEARTRLDDALVFRADEEFLLEGKGDPNVHFDVVSRRVVNDSVDRADALGIELSSASLDWPSPVGDEVQPTLVAINVIDRAMRRLFSAHERARSWDSAALGLVEIESFKVVTGRGTTRGTRRSSASRRGELSADDLVLEDKVRFKFRGDETTTRLFLESCLSGAPRITLSADFKMTTGQAPGDPLEVSGTLSALRLRAN